jgi:hypothetical protein
MQLLLNFHILKFFIQFKGASDLKGMPENFEKHGKQINNGIGMVEEFISGQGVGGNMVGSFGDIFFKLLNFVTGVLNENILCNKEMEKFFFNFGVHENAVGDVDKELIFVDIPLKPGLSCEAKYHVQRYHVFALDLLTRAHTLLVGLLVTLLRQVLDQRDEHVLWVVLLKLQLRVRVATP